MKNTPVCRNKRRGTTLTEVLMSLLIMGIGVVFLASMFPISVLRSVQATKLTNAAILKLNTEPMLKVQPHLIDGAQEWQPDTPYAFGDIVVPNPPNGRFYICTTQGISNSTPPDWLTQPPIADGNNVNWAFFPLPQSPRQQRRYVVDPLGWTIANKDGSGLQNRFGTFDGFKAIPGVTQVRMSGGFGIESVADRLASLPDSYVGLVDTPIDENGGFTSTSVFLPPDIDLSGIAFNEDLDANGTWDQATEDYDGNGRQTLNNGPTRIILRHAFSRASEVRTVTNIDLQNNRVIWGEDINGDGNWTQNEDLNGNGQPDLEPLPANFQVLNVRLETRERRYTWMLTVRKTTPTTASVDMAVMFKRSFSPFDEVIYPVVDLEANAPGRGGWRRFKLVDGAPGIAGFDDDGDNNSDNIGETGLGNDTRNRSIIVDFSNLPTAVPKPTLKKGNFVLEPIRLRWYRIYDIRNETDNSAELILDRDIVDDSFYVRNVAAPTILNGHGGVIIMPNVFEVYPLGSLSSDQSPED